MELTGAVWRKSTRSNGHGGDCVEVADNLPEVVGVRDSKDPTGPALTFTPPAWHTFLAGLTEAYPDRRRLPGPSLHVPDGGHGHRHEHERCNSGIPSPWCLLGRLMI